MSSPLPERSQHPAAPDGQRTADPLTESVVRAAVDDVIRRSSYRDESPLPLTGSSPPVPQPGHPPMSQRQTDIGRTALYCGVATVPPGLIAIGVLLASGSADPTVVGMICAAPAALAVPVLAVARLLRGTRPEPEVHIRIEGDVYQDQRTVRTSTRGVWAKTNNKHR